MGYELSISTLLMYIPELIKFIIIGVAIWIGYFFIKEKRRSTTSDSINDPSIYVRVFGVNIKKRTINKVFLVLGSLPLLVYPMVLVANIMSLAALSMSESLLNSILAVIFVIFTSAYLPIYILCFTLYFKKRDRNIIITSIPLMYVALMFFIIF